MQLVIRNVRPFFGRYFGRKKNKEIDAITKTKKRIKWSMQLFIIVIVFFLVTLVVD